MADEAKTRTGTRRTRRTRNTKFWDAAGRPIEDAQAEIDRCFVLHENCRRNASSSPTEEGTVEWLHHSCNWLARAYLVRVMCLAELSMKGGQ